MGTAQNSDIQRPGAAQGMPSGGEIRLAAAQTAERHDRYPGRSQRRGLAAPQVGILRRVVIVDTGEEILELVNPELVETSGEQWRRGGVPQRSGQVRSGEAPQLCQGSRAGPER